MILARRGLLAAALALPALRRAQADDALWTALRGGGCAVLMRHARTVPGTGDPPGFRLGDCSTQRNLDETGRTQSRAWGALLRAEGVPVTKVLSSAWCRCLETAELMALGPVEPFAPLNSFFGDGSGREASREGIRAFVAGWTGPGNAMLVTHQVNITGAYAVTPSMGEVVVVRPDAGGGTVLGRLPPPSAG